MNNAITYFFIAGNIFGLEAALHLIKIINHAPTPVAESWLAFFIAGALSGWSFALMRQEEKRLQSGTFKAMLKQSRDVPAWDQAKSRSRR